MSRFCILTNTKEFKNAQLKFNLDKYSLEKIVYNYYNNVVNSENTFPSDDYINSIINPTITTEDKKLVDFSKKHGYDKPLIFNNLDNFESKLKEVQQFFTNDLIITYTNSNGQSVIKVANFEYKEKEQKQSKLDKELEAIKRAAIANGTFMKAPNGKPTKLNERQWLQVRTKAFKDWFGDWERLAPRTKNDEFFTEPTDATPKLIERLKYISKSSDKYGKLAAILLENELLPYNLRYFTINNNRDDIRSYKDNVPGIAAQWHSVANMIEVLGNNAPEDAINRALLHELIHYNTEYILNKYRDNPDSLPSEQRGAIGELYNIIEYTKSYLEKDIKDNPSKYKEIRDRQGNPVSTRVFYALDGHGSVEIDEFVSEIFTNPAFQEVLNNIPYKNNKEKSIWDKIIDAITSIFGLNVKQGSVLEASLKEASFFLDKENSIKEISKNVSKVVDENGEPKVMLRTDDAGKLVMGRGDGGAFFATDNLSVAGSYAFRGVTDLYKGFINLKNPFIVRGEAHGFFLDYNGKKEVTVQEAQEDLMKEGYDGVYFERTYDKGNYGPSEYEFEYDDPYRPNYWANNVAMFNPNQFKSATDNVGTYSRTDNNIYKENIPFENEKAIGKQDSKLLQMFTKSRRIVLSGNKELTAKDLLPRIKDSRYSSITTLLKALNRIGELDKVKVQLVNGASRNFNRRRAFYDASEKTIYVNTNAQYEDGNASSVLLHEILHSITVDRIQQNPELRKEIQGIMNEYQAVYYDSKYDTRLDSIIDGHHAMEEFIADVWSNPETINNLKNVKTKENKNKSLWDKFKQFLHNLFSGIFLGAANDSLFAKASSSIIKLLETQAESIAVGKYYENGVYIKPNAEQELAIDIMTDYVTNRIEGKQTHPFFLLNGKAGTGKTTIINMLLERLNKEHKLGNVIVAAVANKAKQNLFRKTNYRELKIKSSSIAGILGKGNFLRQQGSGTNYERVSTKKFGAVIENSDLRGPENIIVIDECSMIETKDYEALLALLALRNLTLIFVGDSGQLPQILNSKAQSNTPVSKTFTESSVNASATLLTRVRLGEDNPILAASDEFYVRGYEVDNSDPKKNLSLAKLNTKITDKGAFILKNNDQFDYEKDASALFKRAIETGNMNLVKYVCATNEEVSSFNDLVRRSVFGKEYTKMFKEGDIVMFREQFSAKRSNNPNGKAEKIDNSQEGIIKSFTEMSNDDPSSREGYLSPFVLFCKKLNDYAEKHDGKIPLSVDEMGEELTRLWKNLPVISNFMYDEAELGTPFYEGTDGKLYNVLNTIYLYAKRIKDIKPVRSVSVEMETQSETASEPGLYEMLTIHPEDWEQYEKNIKLLQNNTYFNETNIIQVITRQLFNAIGLKGSIDLKVLRQLGAEMINNSYTNTRARLQYGYAITSHKSQGSTYDVSIINGDSMAKNKVWGFQDKLRMLYTAITRSSNVTMVITNDAFGVRDTESLDVINERINANKKKTGIDNTGETYKPESVNKTPQTPQTPQSSTVEDKVKTVNIDGAATEIEYKYVNERTDKLPQRSADGSIMMYNVSRDLVLQYLFNDSSYREALDKLAQEGYNRNYINSIISNDSIAESFVLLNQYIGFIFKDKYKCLKEVFNQLAQNTGNSSPEVAISEPMPEVSAQDNDFIEDAEFEDIPNEGTLSPTPTENVNTLGEKVEYTPQGKERLTYYIKGSHIYNSKGKEVFVEPSKDRTAIFTNYRVQRGEAVVVEHKGNKYVVNNKNLIVSVRSKKVMEWGEENGDRKAILQLAKQAFELKLNNNQQLSEPTATGKNNRHVEISTSGYRKGDPLNNPNTAYIFTENAEAYGYTHNIDIWHNKENEFPFKGTPKINVSDVNGTNQAGIRTDSDGNISKNAFGIVVKKYQHNALGRFVAQEGTFKDTDSDFKLFTSLNYDMFLRLEKSGLTSIVFPSQIALGKAALPLRFAEWLKQQLESRFNITAEIKTNERKDYIGYGLKLKNNNTKSVLSIVPDVKNLIGGNTQQYGVEIPFKSAEFQSNWQGWQANHPNGIIAYRVNKNTFNTPKAVEQGIIGNPFDWQKYGTGKASDMFYNWLITGNNYNEPKANAEFRLAIIDKILSSKTDTPILYYKELGYPSHATIIGYLINNKLLLSSKSTSINIYAGNNENADLSNFAIRPFSLLKSSVYMKSALFFAFHPFLPEKFQSVELGFLYVKLLVALSKTDWASDYLGDSQVDETSTSYKRGEKIWEVLDRILNTTDGAKLRKLGKSILLTPEEIKEWDNMSSVAMYELLKLSFRLNDAAAARLLKTGNTTLTHNQDNSKWRTEFPRILTEVRDELRLEVGDKLRLKLLNNFKDYYLHSGGANGSDFDGWDLIAREFGGLKGYNHYYHGQKSPKNAPHGNIQLTDELFKEGVQHMNYAASKLGKHVSNPDTIDKLARNWWQAKNGDAVFAIGNVFVTAPNGNVYVKGGTGWAVQMAIDSNKPVYVFLQSTNNWYKRVGDNWVITETPTLTKNFAGIGTRELNESGKQAIRDVYNKTFNSNYQQEKIEAVKKEIGEEGIQDTLDTLNGKKDELNNQERKSAKTLFGTRQPKVLIASETSDPVFHALKIKRMVEAELAKPAYKRNFHMMYIITKHDGLPLADLAKLDIPKFIHFSITSLGGTKYEPGVMKMDDLLDRIQDFINQGVLNPNLITIRIDPIIPGVTKDEDIEHIIERAKSMGIKQFKFSIMDSYNKDLKNKNGRDIFIVSNMKNLGYDWDKYYGTDYKGDINYHAKQEYIEHYYKLIDNLAEKHNVWFNTCGENSHGIQDLKRIKFNMGCVSVDAMNAAAGTNDIADIQGNQRRDCSCYGLKSDALRYGDNCQSSCIYCYAGHNQDSARLYYNEDGTLKDDIFTRTTEPKVEQPVIENTPQAQQQESRVKYENPFILEKSEINSENSIYPAEYVLSVNEEYLNDIEERANDSMSVLSKFLDGVINFSDLPFGAKIRINTGDDKLDVKIQLLFRKNKLLHSTTEFRTIEVDLTTKEGANFVTYLKNLGVISRDTGTQKSGSVVSKVGIYAYTYVKKQRDIENSKQMKELNDKVSGRRLRSLSIGAIYKISELITQIQDGNSIIDTLFDDKQLKEIKELKGKDRITIIGKVGIPGLALIVKDRYFNVNASEEVRNKSLDNLNRKKRKEIKAIYDNFEAFINFGYAKLEELEGVSVDANPHMTQNIIELYDGIDEQEVQELYGSSLEHWLVGFRSVSAVMNLSRLVKSALNSMYDYDIDFNVVKDEYGLEKRVNASEAVSNMLSWFTSVENVEDMIKVLQQKMEKHPWLAQLVNDNPDLKDSEGNLVGIGKLITKDKNKRHPENEEFKSKFFRNMYLYFQKYGIIQSDGNIKVINDKSDISSVIDEVLTNIKTNKELFNNDIPVGKASGNFVDKLIQARKKIADRLNIKGNVEISDEVVKDVKEIFNLLGINLFNEEAIKAVLTANPKYLVQIAKSTSTNNGIANLFLSYNSNSKPVDDEFWKSYKNDINKIVKPFTDFIISKMESVTYQDGKLYYSYVLPSYMSKFNTKIKNGNGFMEKEFKSEFFGLTVSGEKQWLNEWQKRLATEDKAREDFSHKVVLADNGVSYTKKTPKQYMSSILNEYLYHKNKRLAWYRIPMMSNKPSEEYIRFYRYTEGFKSLITDFLVSTTMQEILRISDVLNRAKSVEAGDLSKDSIIKFYDIKTEYKKEAKDRHSDEELIRMGIEQGAGTRFIMLSFLQPYILYALDNKNYQGLGRQLLDLILGNNANTTNIEENSELESNPVDFFGGEAEVGENTTLSLLRTAIMHEMNNSFQEFLNTMEAEGVIEKDKKGNYKTDVNKLGNTNNEILSTLEEFFWNDFYAATSIMLLYITDPAYYGTAEELQKRLAQLHAPGSRLNVLARDKNGKLYSANENGKHIYRLIKLADDKVISDAISNINEVFDLLVKENNGNAPAIAYYEAQRKFIISELEKVNATDAQTFCTPTAMRKKLGMLGEWNEDRENAYQNLVKGKHTKSDLSILMQPLKPFMFSQKQVSDSGGLFNTRRVGVQVKTSEYLLLLADAITRGAGKKTKLATIFDVIEETLATTDTYGNKVPNGKGIDGISFESSIKTGLSGVINLNNLTNEQVEQTLRRCIYAGSDGTNTTSQYNKTFVDELDYEDYSIQLEVPTHFFGKQQLGSQSKALMFADTEEYERDETGKYRKDENGNKVDKYIYVKDKEGNRVRTTVREAKQRYFRLLADSINNAKEKLIRELNLDNANEGVQNVAISELLKKQILEDSRFGSDLLWAVDTNEKGEFNLPLSDPTHSVRIQLLLYAVIKNRIYKQEIHGGPVVQVSNWGNEDLHIRYTNKDGETLLTEDEFNSLKERAKNIKNIKDEKAQRAERASILNKLSEHASTTVNINGKTVSLNTYEQYKKHHMVDGGVVYECYAPVYDERLLKYEDKNGIIDIKRIKQEEPQLLELIGYRIPTEAKYSMASLRIVGFLPREAGEGIMLPKEWTSISGSDFDVDKLYIMRRSFIEVGDEENGLRWEKGTTKQDEINDEIFDIMQGVLESNQSLSKVVKIGTFDPLKVVGYKLAALRELKAQNQRENAQIEARNRAKKPGEATEEYKEFKDTYDSLPNSINSLKNLAIKNKNLSMTHIHLQFFKLNMVAAKLIGVFAQSNISHAYLLMYASSIGSERGIQIEDLEFAQFNLFDQLIHKDDFYIDSLYGFDGTPISDNIAAFLAASVDAVKDPILNLMNVNMKTVNAVMMMARMGFNIEQIGLLFGQDIVTKLTQRMDKYGETFTEAIDNELLFLQKLVDADKELKGVKFDLNLNDKELKLNLVKPSLQLNYTVLKVLQQINKISDDTRSIVHMTRFNSISSAKGPNIIEAIVEQFKTDAYWRSLGDKNYSLNSAILNPVLATTTEAVDSLERMLIGNRFVLAKSHFAETYKAYVQMIGRDVNLIDKKDAKRFSDFYIDYMIHKVSNLFDLSYEHRLEVISTYPEQILALKSDPRFTDNKFIQSIQQRQDKKDKYLGINIELLGVTSDNIEEIKTDFNEFADEEPETTKKLIEYMFNRGGFSFSPKTFTNLITNYIKNKLMPEYLKNVRDLEKENGYFERKDNVELMELSEDIIYQYMLHYGAKNFRKADISSLDDLELPSSKNNTTDLTLGDTFTIYNGIIKDLGIYLLTLPLKNPQKSTDRVFLTVKVDNTTRSGVSTVTVVEKLGGDGQGLEISPNEDVVKSIYNQEKNDNNTPPEAPNPVEPNNPSDSLDNPIDNDYYESLDDVVQEESIRRPGGNSKTSGFLKFKSNPLAGDNSYLASLMNNDSLQPVTSTIQNTDVDIEEAAESAVGMVNETETYPISLLLNYADSLTQTMVDMNTITLKQGNDSAEIDGQSNNCG